MHIFITNSNSEIPQTNYITAKYHTTCISITKETGNVANVSNIGLSNMTDGVHTSSKDDSLFTYPRNLKNFVFSYLTKSEYSISVYDTGVCDIKNLIISEHTTH